MELVQMLTSQLGITDEQARGGAGLLFNAAKEKLSGEEFAQVSTAVPQMDELMAAAPTAGGLTAAVGSLASSLGVGGQWGNLAGVASGFKSLNLDPQMVSRFVPIVLSFVQAKGGESARAILERALT